MQIELDEDEIITIMDALEDAYNHNDQYLDVECKETCKRILALRLKIARIVNERQSQ